MTPLSALFHQSDIFQIDPVEAQNMECTKPEGRENILKRLNINTDTV